MVVRGGWFCVVAPLAVISRGWVIVSTWVYISFLTVIKTVRLVCDFTKLPEGFGWTFVIDKEHGKREVELILRSSSASDIVRRREGGSGSLIQIYVSSENSL